MMPSVQRRSAAPVAAEWLGRIGYDEASELQRRAAAGLAAGGGEERLLLLEHEPVYTLGRNARAADVLFSPERCRALGVAVRESDRGGQVTYHGPGQLVAYTLLDRLRAREARDLKALEPLEAK